MSAPFPRRAWGALRAFVEQREDAASLALCRMLLGVSLAVHLLRFWWSGGAKLAWTHVDHGGLSTSSGWLELIGGGTERNVELVLACCVLASFCAALGIGTRIALVLAWGSLRTLSSLNSQTRGAYDYLYIDALFLLFFSNAGALWSVDARARHDAPALRAARWPRILLVAQLGFLYGGSAWMKASSGWVPGGDASALWFILHQPMFARFDVNAIPAWTYPLTQVATTISWLWELSAPLFVLAVLLREAGAPRTRFMRACKRALDTVRFRELWLLLGVGVHLGIELAMDVGPFCAVSLALYPCAIQPREWRAWLVRLTPSSK